MPMPLMQTRFESRAFVCARAHCAVAWPVAVCTRTFQRGESHGHVGMFNFGIVNEIQNAGTTQITGTFRNTGTPEQSEHDQMCAVFGRHAAYQRRPTTTGNAAIPNAGIIQNTGTTATLGNTKNNGTIQNTGPKFQRPAKWARARRSRGPPS